MSKKFILDKNVFISEDIIRLDNLSRRYTVILPAVLVKECATSDDLKPKRLLQKINDLILNNAWIALEEPKIIRKEIQELKPCSDIIDYDLTYDIRKNGLPNENNLSQQEIKPIIWSDIGWQKKHIFNMINVAKERCPEVLQNLKRDNLQAKERWIKLFEIIEGKFNFHEFAIECKHITNDVCNPDIFCTSSEWMFWHYLRLLNARSYYDQLKIHTGGQLPADENFERSRMDMEYVWLLAKADVLLTNDNEMKAMAEAAFPEKSIFAGIDEFTQHR